MTNINELEEIQLKNLMKALDDYCKEFNALYKKQLRDGDKIASGTLLSSIETKIRFNGTEIYATLYVADYYKYVENGRRPGGKFPPVLKIERWIEEKNIVPRPDKNGKLPTTKQLAFLIGRKIAHEGIRPTNYIANTLSELNTKYEAIFKDAIQSDFDNYSIYILRDIDESLKKIF